MSGKVFFIPLSFLFIVSFKQYVPVNPYFKLIQEQFNKADRLFNLASSTPATDSVCMTEFRIVISKLNKLPHTPMTDSLMYQAYYKVGVLCEVYNDFQEAKESYLHAINFSLNPHQKLSMYIFAGTGYYKLNNFDSASFFLLLAEENITSIGSSEDRVRLYNTLGVLYYDNGNYLQSKNYFTQALRLIETNKKAEDLTSYGVRLNMATCNYKLGLYEQALEIYRKSLVYQKVNDPLYMNMGRAYAGLHQYKAALTCFRKVKITAVPGVLNEMAKTALETGEPDSASAWLNQYQNGKKSLHTNALDDGVNELYSADLALFRSSPGLALQHLQAALIIFSKSFANNDIRKNPESFMGSFAYYRLFEVLDKKAKAWEMIYRQNAKPEDLKAAYDAYESTISLLTYIERSYEMDDAKILLKQNSGQVYMDALTVCLQLNKLFPDANYLDEAFLIAEKNKASIMSSQIRESNFLQSTGKDADLVARERNIKFNIARLNTKADDRMEPGVLQKLNDEKSVYETELVNLRREMEDNTRFYKFKYLEDFPSISQLQKSMGSGTALISFYNTPEKIELFVITKTSLRHTELDSGQSIRRNIQSWIQILQTAESGRHVQTKYLLDQIYIQLVKPIEKLAGDQESWIVVPDGVFFQLPLESLPGDPDGGLIIERHALSYEFSARFIADDNRNYNIPVIDKPLISFAPFSKRGVDLQSEGIGWLNQLPFSGGETSSLGGSRLMDRQATKEAFIKNLNHFPIEHLATHAMSDPDNPSASYIAFYPVTGRRTDDLLFLDEVYALRMDSCRMMVISACETGKGALVRNEGAMSFARAFLYAGCPSTINTLWKADDRSTSEILNSFYRYLEKGYAKPIALQKAKLEFIRKNPVKRNPSYWSHLILTGSPVPLYKKKQPMYWAVFAIIFGTILFFTVRKRKKKKVDAFHS